MEALPPWPWNLKQRQDYIDWSTKFIAANLDRLEAMDRPCGVPVPPPCTNEFVAPGCEQFTGKETK